MGVRMRTARTSSRAPPRSDGPALPPGRLDRAATRSCAMLFNLVFDADATNLQQMRTRGPTPMACRRRSDADGAASCRFATPPVLRTRRCHPVGWPGERACYFEPMQYRWLTVRSRIRPSTKTGVATTWSPSRSLAAATLNSFPSSSTNVLPSSRVR